MSPLPDGRWAARTNGDGLAACGRSLQAPVHPRTRPTARAISQTAGGTLQGLISAF